MTLMRKISISACLLGVSALSMTACAGPYGPNHYGKTNHFGPGYVNQMPQKQMNRPSLRSLFGLKKQKMRGPMPMPQFQRWVEYEPQYRFYPGDQVDIVVSSAPELSRTLTIGPDGRIVMPMTQPIMAAGRTFAQVQAALSTQLSKQLRDPRVAITPRAYAPEQIFVGGAVGAQGMFTMPGPMGAIEAIMMAGGFSPTARSNRVAVMRRAPNGGMMMRTVNIGRGMKNMGQYNDVLQLRRGDIVFVPRTHLAEAAIWMQTFRDAMPVDFNLSYQLGNNNNGATTVISP